MKTPRDLIAAAGILLSERDYAVLHDVNRFKVMTSGQIKAVHFAGDNEASTKRMCQATLTRLTRRDVLARIGDRGIGGTVKGSVGFTYCAGEVGMTVARLTSTTPRRPLSSKAASLPHFLAVAELYVALTEADRAGLLTLNTFLVEGNAWRDYGERRLEPDAYVDVTVPTAAGPRRRRFFVEMDRDTQHGYKIAPKVPSYLNYRNSLSQAADMPGVLFVAPNATRVRYLKRMIERQASADARLFRVTAFQDFLQAL